VVLYPETGLMNKNSSFPNDLEQGCTNCRRTAACAQAKLCVWKQSRNNAKKYLGFTGRRNS